MAPIQILFLVSAYSNILKHSGASKVNVTLNLRNSELEIELRDNGKGFRTDQNGNGNGLNNMKNRVERMNGRLAIISDEKKGTEINITLNTIFI